MDKNTNITLFSSEQIEQLTVPALEFIHKQSADYLAGLNAIANRITERAYVFLIILVAVCPTLSGFLTHKSVDLLLNMLIILSFVISGYFIFLAIRPFGFACNGMTPRDMVDHMDMDQSDLHKNALLLMIYSNQANIDFVKKINKTRTRLYLCSVIILLCASVAAISLIVSIS